MKKILTMLCILSLAAACLAGCGKKTSDITLGQYKGLKYKKATIEVSDADLQAIVESIQKSYITYEEIPERQGTEVKKGDVLNIDYSGMLDGETTPFNGGTDKGAHLEIGSGAFIPGFEDGLIGKTVGSKVVISLNFPEQYYAELAGKKVSFAVTINAVEKKNVPAITDELIAKYTENRFTTVEAYKAFAKEYMLAQKEEAFKTTLRTNLVGEVVNATKFGKLDQEKLDGYYNDLITYYTSLAAKNNQTLDAYAAANFGKSGELFYAEVKAAAEKTMKEELVLQEIIVKEKIVLSDADYKNFLPEYMEHYGYKDQAAFEEAYTVNRIRQSMLYDLAMKFIVDNAIAE